MVLLTFGNAERLQNTLEIVQFTLGLISPSGTLLRVLLLALNQSQLLCREREFMSYPGDITVYGGPYLYFVLQIVGLYTYLVCHDSGWRPAFINFKSFRTPAKDDEKEANGSTEDVLHEAKRAETCRDELRLLHVNKEFRHKTVVDNATFAVDHGEALALLGPNGAGKTTTLGLIRGNIQPSTSKSEILISGHSIRTNRLTARNHLGVCPQFNAIDRLTVIEHLKFYARIRGVPDITGTVESVMQAVGLTQYRKRFIAQLSGGNQRKLSLATAIVGNPSVVLLDEPSSGMDALAMRSMWQAIQDVSSNRAVMITTHSMEEATALANRAAIMDKRILAIGSPGQLVERYGRGVYQLHIVHQKGPLATTEELEHIQRWILQNCAGASARSRGVGSGAMHGQLRFQVVVENSAAPQQGFVLHSDRTGGGDTSPSRGLVRLLELLEESKERFNVEYYSISPMTLEDVFLEIVAR